MIQQSFFWVFTQRSERHNLKRYSHPMFVTALFTTAKIWKQRKDPDAGTDWEQEEKGKTEDEMVGWHHQLKRT